MQVQTQLSWSQRIAEMICQQSDGERYHKLSLKRWACVQAMTLMAVACTDEHYGEDEYVSFMKRHLDLYIQEDGSVGTCSLEAYNLDRDGSYSYYVGEQIVSDSFMGVAPLLLAALEMERLP
ncbi:hypothetical protein [Paenibacillus pabuli]|uniref:hypothetical protein n=1 Tax=Paenibacillus pabuli TaxID=1472 RepID=UPI000784B302|nr:hypothetical protein [Paenibacillus pabuli]MEC0123141.1 hypothetical protein [Paenibacillus pabuli]